MRPLLSPSRLAPLVLLASLASPPARASAPTAVYVVASQVDFLPDARTATSVVIHGAFFFWMNGGTYSAPACGVMHFICPKGAEATCRQEWNDVVTYAKNQSCAGFGPMMMVNTATFYKEGAPLGKPDPWGSGMGVQPGGFVDGKCQPALMMRCPLAPPPVMDMSMGVPDMAVSTRDMAMARPDLTSAPADLAQQPPAPDMSTPPSPDLAMKPPKVDVPSGSCSVSRGPTSTASLVLLALAAGLIVRRRRR